MSEKSPSSLDKYKRLCDTLISIDPDEIESVLVLVADRMLTYRARNNSPLTLTPEQISELNLQGFIFTRALGRIRYHVGRWRYMLVSGTERDFLIFPMKESDTRLVINLLPISAKHEDKTLVRAELLVRIISILEHFG